MIPLAADMLTLVVSACLFHHLAIESEVTKPMASPLVTKEILVRAKYSGKDFIIRSISGYVAE
jgi:hypothetical protein